MRRLRSTKLVEWDVREGNVVPLCRGCRYALDGLGTSGQCPECGAAFVRTQRAPEASEIERLRRRQGWTDWMLVPLVIATIFVVVWLAGKLLASL